MAFWAANSKGSLDPRTAPFGDRQLALQAAARCLQRPIIDKGYRSVFIGEHARTKEEKAIDSFVAAPLYSDTLSNRSKGLRCGR